MAKEIIDALSMKRALMRMTYEIVERNDKDSIEIVK